MNIDDDYLFSDEPITADDTEAGDETVSEQYQAVDDEQSGETSTPPVEEVAGQENPDDQNSKMIPEHRFKAALKSQQDVVTGLQEELNAVKAKLAKHEELPEPDRYADPDGYEFIVRLKTSNAIMATQVPDYGPVIEHFKEMAKANPMLEGMLQTSETPALFAYQLAKEDMEITKAREVYQSDDFKEFQEWKKAKAAATEQAVQQAVKPSAGLAAAKVPNLNKVSSATAPKLSSIDDAEELFKGAL